MSGIVGWRLGAWGWPWQTRRGSNSGGNELVGGDGLARAQGGQRRCRAKGAAVRGERRSETRESRERRVCGSTRHHSLAVRGSSSRSDRQSLGEIIQPARYTSSPSPPRAYNSCRLNSRPTHDSSQPDAAAAAASHARRHMPARAALCTLHPVSEQRGRSCGDRHDSPRRKRSTTAETRCPARVPSMLTRESLPFTAASSLPLPPTPK